MENTVLKNVEDYFTVTFPMGNSRRETIIKPAIRRLERQRPLRRSLWEIAAVKLSKPGLVMTVPPQSITGTLSSSTVWNGRTAHRVKTNLLILSSCIRRCVELCIDSRPHSGA
jgi:hypothetical protein